MSKIARLIKDKIYIITFLSIISIPAIQLFTNAIDINSNMEKRTKASRPSIGDFENLGEYFSSYETYFNDNFGFRSNLIGLNSKVDVNLFKQSSNSQVIIGTNDYLYFKDEMPDYHKTNLLTDDEIDIIANKVAKFQKDLAKRDIYFLISLAPNKSTIYPEFVGIEPTNPTATSNLDRLQKAFDKHKVNYIDLKSELLKHKKENELYYKKDTHWNSIGSNIGANLYLSKLNKEFGTNISLENQNIRQGIYDGDLDNLLGFYSKTPEMLSDSIIINPADTKLPKAVSYGDSFGGTLFLDISDAFEQNIIAHTISAPPASNYHLLSENAKILNFEIVERNIQTLVDYEFTIFDDDTSTINKLYNPIEIDLKPNKNIIFDDLAIIKNEDSTYISNKQKNGYLTFKNLKDNQKIDFIYFELEDNNAFIPIYFNFNNEPSFVESEKNLGLMLLPTKNKYIIDLRRYNTSFKNLNLKIGDQENTYLKIKDIKIYTTNNLKEKNKNKNNVKKR